MIFLILSLWIVVCVSFIFMGKDLGETALPVHRKLVLYSTLIFLLTFLYYFVSFTRENIIEGYIPSFWAHILAVSMLCAGAFLMCLSRWELRSLSLSEMVFSLNPTKSEKGVYRYLHHPMYLGIILLLCGSFVLYPTIPGVFLFLGIGFLLFEKMTMEK